MQNNKTLLIVTNWVMYYELIMTLSLAEKQERLAECKTSSDFYNLYALIFKEEVPRTGLRSGGKELDLIIDAIINNKKIKEVKNPDGSTGERI